MRRTLIQRAAATGAAVAGGGAAAGAATAAACCVGPVVSPLIVAVLGASGAASVAGLKPFTPYLLIGSLLVLGYGFRLVYRRPKSCPVDAPRTRSPLWIRIVLWASAAVWLASVSITLFVAG